MARCICNLWLVLVTGTILLRFATAQQTPTEGASQGSAPFGQQFGGQGPTPLPLPPEFRLNALQQAELDVVLDLWETKSAEVNTFHCPFERLEYNQAFGPGPNVPLFHNLGELSFEKPDKGSFQITEVRKWVPQPGQAGQFLKDPSAVGEHWVCDGKNIYEYRHQQKQLVVRPIPANLQGKAIMDGPLPFLFGAEAAKLKARYWLRLDENYGRENPDYVLVDALPRFQSDAANYSRVQVILDRHKMLPSAMQVHLPNRDRNVYTFDLEKAKVNSIWQQVKSWFAPPELRPGWQRVVEEMPLEQAAQPGAAPR
jgi:TIGR03009 family protein